MQVVLALAFFAGGDWTPPDKLKITWPAQFSVKEVAVNRIQEAEHFICVRGKKGDLNYLYAAKAADKVDLKAAAEAAKKKGKFEILSAGDDEAVLKRGSAIAYISFSHRALPCRAVIKAKKGYAEMFFEVDVPKTTIVTEDDWMEFCEEASQAIEAGAP
jgi:hypothetical protein